MNIDNKLYSWLSFDHSATRDFVVDNHWEVYGNPVLSPTNAINGNALQLDGNTYLKLAGVPLGGIDWTFDAWFYVDASSPDYGRLFSIANPENNIYMLSLRKSKTNADRLEVWANTNINVDVDWGSGYFSDISNNIGKRIHVALCYTYSGATIRLFINGSLVISQTNSQFQYSARTFDFYIGATHLGRQGLIGSVDEIRFHKGKALWTSAFTPPTASSYQSFTFPINTKRNVRRSDIEWRYENEGTIDSLVNTTTGVNLTNLPATKSLTGKAFYQTTRTKIFDVPSTNVVWMKFDVYFDGVNRWRAYDEGTGSNGITAQTSGDISFFANSNNVQQPSKTAKINQLQTLLLYMYSDSTNGIIEAWTIEGQHPVLLYSYKGNVNGGSPFEHLDLQSDGAGTFFSNVIISNSPLELTDSVASIKIIDLLISCERRLMTQLPLLMSLDTERRIASVVSCSIDLERIASNGYLINLQIDTERIIDIERIHIDSTLVSWIHFDSRSVANYSYGNIDIIKENSWYRSDKEDDNFAEITTTNAKYGYSIHLNGQNIIDNIGTSLGGKDFTLDGWFKLDQIPEKASIVHVSCYGDGDTYYPLQTPDLGAYLLDLSVLPNGKLWMSVASTNNCEDCIHTDYTTNFTCAANTWYYYAIIYDHVSQAVKLFINGNIILRHDSSVQFPEEYYTVKYAHGIDNLSGNIDNPVSGVFYGYLDELCIWNGRALYAGNHLPPTASYYNTISVNFATERIVEVVWRYENIGKTDSLINTSTGVTLSNLPISQSTTKTAFYQTTRTKIFDVPATHEIWIKFDVYFNGTHRWRAYDEGTGSNGCSGITAAQITSSSATTGTLITFVDNTARGSGASSITKKNTLQTYILHMFASNYATNGTTTEGVQRAGVVEAWRDGNDTVIYRYTGTVNGGLPFEHLNLQSDGAGTFFSNIIISNAQLTWNDNANLTQQLTVPIDTVRYLQTQEIIAVDLSRIITTGKDVVLTLPTERRVGILIELPNETARHIANQVRVELDAEVYFQYSCTVHVDLLRIKVIPVDFFVDIHRVEYATVIFKNDLLRTVNSVETVNLDIIRKIPYTIHINGFNPSRPSFHLFRKAQKKTFGEYRNETPSSNTSELIPIGEENIGIQSIVIQINEQQVTDKVTFVHAGYCEIMELIRGNIYDYLFSLRIEDTSTQGIMQTCNCCTDVDELLYTQMAYSVPEDRYVWSEDYNNGFEARKSRDPDIEKQPLTNIYNHLASIAEAIGKTLVYRAADWYSSVDPTQKEGKTYANLVSELIGWTSRLPQLMMNCYIRDNTMFVIQRGYEENVICIDELNITVPTIHKKLIRTTWGSDVWSKDLPPNVQYDDYKTLVKSPFDPFDRESGETFDDEGLKESTTVETDTELQVTRYYYKTQENGKKYLYKEETEYYEKNGSTLTLIDTRTTTHDMASINQSHNYTIDDSGGILGNGLSQNQFDDRPTPYRLKQNDAGEKGYIVLQNGKTGEYYKVYSIVNHHDAHEIGHRVINGISLIDRSFPIYGDDNLSYLTQQLVWLNRKTEEEITLVLYDYPHVIDFNDRIEFQGNQYFLRSNIYTINESIINSQSLTFVRWY